MLEKLKSRKLWVTFGVIGIVNLLLLLGVITAEKAAELSALVGGTYVLGQGAVDAVGTLKK